jgi:hypothetical protein
MVYHTKPGSEARIILGFQPFLGATHGQVVSSSKITVVLCFFSGYHPSKIIYPQRSCEKCHKSMKKCHLSMLWVLSCVSIFLNEKRCLVNVITLLSEFTLKSIVSEIKGPFWFALQETLAPAPAPTSADVNPAMDPTAWESHADVETKAAYKFRTHVINIHKYYHKSCLICLISGCFKLEINWSAVETQSPIHLK